MTYAVAYFDGIKIGDIPFRCPVYSRQYFEEKKRLEMPCALVKREDGESAVILDSFQYDLLEQQIKKSKEIVVDSRQSNQFDKPLEPTIDHDKPIRSMANC